MSARIWKTRRNKRLNLWPNPSSENTPPAVAVSGTAISAGPVMVISGPAPWEFKPPAQ